MTESIEGEDDLEPLSSDHDISRSISHAVDVLSDLDANISEEIDLENVTVTINAHNLASICGALLSYCEEYDGVDVSEMFEMRYLERSHGTGDEDKRTIH
jgi:hypothetical protein